MIGYKFPCWEKIAEKKNKMKKSIKIPIRTCLGCQNKRPKRELLRIIKTPEGNIEIDPTGKKSGRGAYLCYNKECLEEALREKRLCRELKQDIPPQTINELRRFLEDYTSKSPGK